MPLSITQKLVIAFLSLTAIVLAGTLLLARWSFQQGFLDYVNALEQKRLQLTAEELAELYMFRNRNWQQVLTTNLVRQLNRSARGFRPGPPASGRAPPADPPAQALPQPHPPPHRLSAGHPPPPHHRGADSRPPPRRGGMPPTALYAADGTHLAGPRFSDNANGLIVVPVTVEEMVVGELRTQPRRQLNTTQETTFAAQQRNASLIIALGALLIALGISIVLARGLLAPVRRLSAAVNRMANGEYDIPPDTSLPAGGRDELARLLHDVQRLAHTLRESQAARRRWLADISHELRTPVTILSGELEALADGLRTLDQSQLDSFTEEVQRINKLVDDLYQLAVSDIGALRYRFAQMDVYQCIARVVALLSQQADNGEPQLPITLSGGSAVISADEDRLHQLFMNLLRNSLFYTDRPGKIEIDVKIIGEQADINIHDTAPGVDAAQSEHLFEPLYRGRYREDTSPRRHAGAGLGLAICRSIVDAHHGSISAAPSPIGGLHIHIQLPRGTV